jgi:hypothetical protein
MPNVVFWVVTPCGLVFTNISEEVGFEVLTAVSMKIAVFWVVAPSETLVNFYQTTRCYNPEDSNLHFGGRYRLDFRVTSSLTKSQ